DLSSNPGGIVTSEFYGYNGTYAVVDSLRPGKGYWVKSSQSGQIIISSSAASPANRIRIVHTNEVPPPAPADDIANSGNSTPAAFELFQNYPNPFNPSTVIRYQLPAAGHVVLKIFTILGEEVATLVNESQSAGLNSVTWDANREPSGVYVCALTLNGRTQAKKIVLMR
ncbi:MAG TPA: T9SS type A sorting domain-containing protein, partial [Bacteroidota bacterium]|nr:T9SS type A sorting domain-containing protein [Bacteroidota bacterium]